MYWRLSSSVPPSHALREPPCGSSVSIIDVWLLVTSTQPESCVSKPGLTITLVQPPTGCCGTVVAPDGVGVDGRRVPDGVGVTAGALPFSPTCEKPFCTAVTSAAP